MTDQQTTDLYLERGFLGRVGGGERPAILVIDLINGFTDPAAPTGSNLDAEVAATRQLLDEARRLGVPIFFTTTAYERSLRDAGLWVRKIPAIACLIEGTPLVEVDARLARRSDEPLLTKKFSSGFFGTSLLAQLIAARRDTVLITGCTTSGCVRATATDAIGYGFHTLIPRETVGDRAELPHQANLFDIDAKFGDVISLQEAIDYLRAVASATAPTEADREESLVPRVPPAPPRP